MYRRFRQCSKCKAVLACAVFSLLVFSASPIPATALEHDNALARGVEDPNLEWGPCPEFLPDGCRIAVLHGKPDQPNLDVFFRVPAKSKLARHWHTSPERMVLVSGELHVTYDGQETAVLTPGMYAYGPAKRPHTGYCASDGPCVLFIAFNAPLDAVPIEAVAE